MQPIPMNFILLFFSSRKRGLGYDWSMYLARVMDWVGYNEIMGPYPSLSYSIPMTH